VIHNEPDGLNINKDCGSQHTDDLKRAVVENGAAVGSRSTVTATA